MDIARHAAPEIDRLVWSVNNAVAATHGSDVDEVASAQGLDSTDLLFHLGDFLLAGVLTSSVAVLRLRYAPPLSVLQRLEDLQDGGFVELADGGLVATQSLRPVLDAMYGARASVAESLWQGQASEVRTVSGPAREVALAATEDHVVAAAHRALPEPSNDFARLHHRLITLRYVRQHDHAAAWQSRGLTPEAMSIMTALWHGDTPEVSAAVPPVLVERALVTDGPMQLTPLGRQLRNEIEEDTNRRAQENFEILDENQAEAVLTALRTLPGTPV